jgi:rhamnosyl/mannosyltransferase
VALLLNGLKDHIVVDNLVANDVPRYSVEKKDGYSVYKVPSFGLAASTAIAPTFPFFARKIWQENGYDIAHLHFPDPLSHLTTGWLPRSARIVITWHSDIIRQKFWLKLYQPWLDRIVRRSDAIVAATPRHFATSTQLGVCDRRKQRVIHYGIDASQFDETAAVARQVAEIRAHYGGKPLIFTVGRQVYYKGFEYLIRAMEDVDAILLLGGSGPLHDALKAVTDKLNLSQRVKFVGRIADADLAAYYHAADLFCMPSVERSEAFGLVQLEAMAARKPVICCELRNGVTYVNQNNRTGLVVPPRDPIALAQAMKRLIADASLSRKFGDAGFQRVHDEFSVEQMVAGHLALYRDIMKSR